MESQGICLKAYPSTAKRKQINGCWAYMHQKIVKITRFRGQKQRSELKKMNDQMIALQKPFAIEDIEFRVGSTSADKSKGIALAYLTNRAIMKRLDDIFGPFGWRNEYKEWKGNSQLCGISIKHE